MKSLVLALALLAVGSVPTFAQINLSAVGQVYTQNFDSLATTGTANPWANDSTLQGWSLFNKTGAAITAYAANDGSTNTGSFYSFGTASSTDRALGGVASSGVYFGSPASGTLAGYIALALKNTTGASLTGAQVSFDGEQWRNGGNTSAQTMTLEYGLGSSFSAVSNWTTAGAGFNWASPVVGSTAATVNGNVAGLVANVGGTISGLTWNDQETLWIRWIENNDAGNDHGLAIDNLTVTAIPEPSTYALILGSAGFTGVLLRRRRCTATI